MKRRVVLYRTYRELPRVERSSKISDETSLGAAYGSLFLYKVMLCRGFTLQN